VLCLFNVFLRNKCNNFALLSDLAGRAGLVVKAVAEPHALQNGKMSIIMHKRYLPILFILVALKALVLLYAILHAGIGLGPDEAQYWTWSRHLDWGYYSKPPGIAWEIALGTSLFGNTELGVRFMPLAIGSMLPFLVYLMAKRCRLTPSASFWAAVCMAFCPLGILASFLAITDGGMTLFWTLACAYLAGKVEEKSLPSYPLIGLCVFFGALFKWPIYSLWFLILVFWTIFPFLRSWRILLGIATSLIALLPSVYWNATHEWATFRHVSATLSGGHAQPKAGAFFSGNLLEFIGAQAALVSPILFVLLVLAWRHLAIKKEQVPNGVLFCGGISLVIVSIGALLAFFMKIQGNWAIFAYPTAFILLGWFAIDSSLNKKTWLIGGVAVSILACTFVFSIPFLQSHGLWKHFPIPYKINPFRHNVGGDRLALALETAGYDGEKDFLFGDKYQTASILSFYGPEQKRAYFFNLQGSRKNQFSFWERLETAEKGNKGFFAAIENTPQLNNIELPDRYIKDLSPYFDTVRFIGMQPLFQAYGEVVKGVLLFECEGYTGLLPAETDLY